jgi:hypothetical protein
MAVTIPQLVGYFNNEIGLNDLVGKTKPIVAEISKSKDKVVNCQDIDKSHCYNVVNGSEIFDPECCVNYTSILAYLSKKSNLKIEEIKL